MSNIRYNTNSNLIQRFQRNENLNKQNKRISGSYSNSLTKSDKNSGISNVKEPSIHELIDPLKENTTILLNSRESEEKISKTSHTFTSRQNNIKEETEEGRIEPNMIQEDDPPFASQFTKNSDEYLEDLCDSIYPVPLHKDIKNICNLKDGSLEMHSFFALLVDNFINYWYGNKIPSNNPELLETIFQILNNLICFLQSNSKTIDINRLFLEDIPILIGEHVKVLRKIKQYPNPNQLYEEYLRLSLIDDDVYPTVITNLIQDNLYCDSILQQSFLDSFFNEFLLGRILDSCSEPYYLLRAITKISEKVIRQKKYKKENENILSNDFLLKIFSKISSMWSATILLFSLVTGYMGRNARTSHNTNIMKSYIWTLINIDILSLDKRKPLIYVICRYVQYILSSFQGTINGMSVFVEIYVWNTIFSVANIKSSMNFLRTMLFPNDNNMGPRTIIPVGQEFRALKLDTQNKLWQAIKEKNLNILLGISEDDTRVFIEMICQEDKRCNKILILQIIDCIMAHLVQKK